jgi:hypothetical protein
MLLRFSICKNILCRIYAVWEYRRHLVKEMLDFSDSYFAVEKQFINNTLKEDNRNFHC